MAWPRRRVYERQPVLPPIRLVHCPCNCSFRDLRPTGDRNQTRSLLGSSCRPRDHSPRSSRDWRWSTFRMWRSCSVQKACKKCSCLVNISKLYFAVFRTIRCCSLALCTCSPLRSFWTRGPGRASCRWEDWRKRERRGSRPRSRYYMFAHLRP